MSHKRALINKLDPVAIYTATPKDEKGYGQYLAGLVVTRRHKGRRSLGPARFGAISYPLRAGYATRTLPRGEKFNGFIDADAANRAIRRAERWIAKITRINGDINKPPRHIVENAVLADHQANG